MNPLEIRQLRILIWHVEPLLALGLAAVLRQQAHLDVLTSNEGAIASLDPSVDIVIADCQGALEFVAESALAQRRVRILALTSRNRAEGAEAALAAGVHGVLPLGCGIDELTRCIDVVASGALGHAGPMAPAEENRLMTRGWNDGTFARRLRKLGGTVGAHVGTLMGSPDTFRRDRASGSGSRRGFDDKAHHSPEPEWRHGAASPSTS